MKIAAHGHHHAFSTAQPPAPRSSSQSSLPDFQSVYQPLKKQMQTAASTVMPSAAPAGSVTAPAAQSAPAATSRFQAFMDPAVLQNCVFVNGSPISTQTYYFDQPPDAASVNANQGYGVGVKIVDRTGARPSLDVLPTDNYVDVARANNIPIPGDGGASYIVNHVLMGEWRKDPTKDLFNPGALQLARDALAARGFSNAEIQAVTTPVTIPAVLA